MNDRQQVGNEQAPQQPPQQPAALPAPSVDGSMRVQVQVDHLGITGLAPQHQQRFLQALRRELYAVAMTTDLADSDANRAVRVPHVSVGRLGPNVTPEAAAAQVARRIGQQMQTRNGTQDGEDADDA